ncbi:MAG TPA: TatD family hydrolase [Burkholderiales bacterium]|nr:TatD family hydrolase [Burkholderiales bacterium]
MADLSTAPTARAPAALIDIGINLAHDSYDSDRDAVLARAAAAGVVQLIVTGSTLASTRAAIALARAHSGRLFATAGVHPHHASELGREALAELRELARAPEVVAVGECGLDYYRNFSPPDLQRQGFAAQLALAGELGKPVFLHQRDAHEDFAAMLAERAREWHGVAHCFTGGAAELDAYLALGLAIGITGWICDERRGAHLLGLVRDIPPGRLLLETDSPYLTPRDMRPQPKARRNEPSFLPHILRTVARALGRPAGDVAAETTRNARLFFSLP